MAESDIRDNSRSRPAEADDVTDEPLYADIRSPAHAFSAAVQAGLASLLIGCTMLLASCVLLVFNVILFRGGRAGIPVTLAFVAGLVGAFAGIVLAVSGGFFGCKGVTQAYAERSPAVLAAAGLVASGAGLVAWLIASGDLVMILGSFLR